MRIEAIDQLGLARARARRRSRPARAARRPAARGARSGDRTRRTSRYLTRRRRSSGSGARVEERERAHALRVLKRDAHAEHAAPREADPRRTCRCRARRSASISASALSSSENGGGTSLLPCPGPSNTTTRPSAESGSIWSLPHAPVEEEAGPEDDGGVARALRRCRALRRTSGRGACGRRACGPRRYAISLPSPGGPSQGKISRSL